MSQITIQISVDGDRIAQNTKVEPDATLNHLGAALGQLELVKMVLLRQIGKASEAKVTGI